MQIEQIKVKDVLKNVSVPPDFFTEEKSFNPFKHWKDDPNDLEAWKEELDDAVQKIASTSHKGFNTAISSFSKILSAFTGSQAVCILFSYI